MSFTQSSLTLQLQFFDLHRINDEAKDGERNYLMIRVWEETLFTRQSDEAMVRQFTVIQAALPTLVDERNA